MEKNDAFGWCAVPRGTQYSKCSIDKDSRWNDDFRHVAGDSKHVTSRLCIKIVYSENTLKISKENFEIETDFFSKEQEGH